MDPGNIGPTQYGDCVVASATTGSRTTQPSLAGNTSAASVHLAPPKTIDAYTVHSCKENATNETQVKHQNGIPTRFSPLFQDDPPGKPKKTVEISKPEELRNRFISHHSHLYRNVYMNAGPGRSYPMGPPSESGNMYAYGGPPSRGPYATPIPSNRAMVAGHQGQGMIHHVSTMPLYPGQMPPYAPPSQQIVEGSHFRPMASPPAGFHDNASSSQGPQPLYIPGYPDPQGNTHSSMQSPPPSSIFMGPGPPKRQLPGPWPYHAPRPITSNLPTYNQPYLSQNGSYTANGSGSNNNNAQVFTPRHFVGIDERPGPQGPPHSLPIISDETRAKQETIRRAAHEASFFSSKKGRNRHDGAAFRDEYWKRTQNNPTLPVAPYHPPPLPLPPAFIDRISVVPRQNIRHRLSPYCHPYIRVTSEHIRKAIPKEASAIFHILDRRVNFDAHEADASMYSLLRSWVQDDPFRYTPPAGSNLLEYISLPSQRRIDYVHENDDEDYVDGYEGDETQEGPGIGPLDVFAKLKCLKHAPSIHALRASQVIRGGKRRKNNIRAHKRRHFKVLQSLKRLGIDLACIKRKK